MTMDRREFIKLAGVQAGLLAAGGCGARSPGAISVGFPVLGSDLPDVVVIGAGAFGGWTAFHLRRMGASVVLVDQYGPGNSRATSGDETRGIRSSYGERELWVQLANQAIDRWTEWEEEWASPFKLHLFFNTGDLILRPESEDSFIVHNRASWDKLGIPYEVLSIDEVRYRWPQINTEGMNAALYEPRAGVVRARRACEVVAERFRHQGGKIVIARATLGPRSGSRLEHILLDGKEPLRAGQYVFACGPWLPKVLPEVMADRLRTPLGRVVYFGTPPGDERFTYPNLPSFNFPGVTGWPALGLDNRGFRVRGGSRRGAANAEGGTRQPEAPARPASDFDPDLSVRWVPPEAQEGPRAFVAERFPDLAQAPVVATYACHYESSVDRNPIVDRYPGLDNVWIAGGGSAEGFKLGPVIGEYIARRVLARRTDPVWDREFRLKEEKFEASERSDGLDY